jgi:single-strand DNA-binding protein
MASLNDVKIIGRVGRDVELRYLPRGTAVCDFSVAVSGPPQKGPDGKNILDENGYQVRATDWFDVSLWERNAEIAAQYVKKGSEILVEGVLKNDHWKDKTTGADRSKVKIVGRRIQLLGERNGESRQHAAPVQEPEAELEPDYGSE